MAGECLSKSFCGIEPSYAVMVYPSVRAWQQSASFTRSSLVLLCASAGGSSDAEVAEIERELVLIKQFNADIPIAVLSDREDARHVLKLIGSGVRCYISSNVPLFMAVRSIQFAIDGGISIPANSLLSILKSELNHTLLDNSREGESFTSRQKEIIKEVQKGRQNKEIARKLNLSESTVKIHVRNVMRKLKAKNRTEIAFRISSSLLRDAID
jgi:DNA-binding NarL/FixJ family response regulator